MIARALNWLESKGIDCSRISNEDDAVALALVAAVAVILALLPAHAYLSGVVTGAGLLKLMQYMNGKRRNRNNGKN